MKNLGQGFKAANFVILAKGFGLRGVFVIGSFHKPIETQETYQMTNKLDQNPNKANKRGNTRIMSKELRTFSECMDILVEPIAHGENVSAQYNRVKNRMGWSFSKAKRAVLGYITRPYGDDLDKARKIAAQLEELKAARDDHEARIRTITQALRQTDEGFHCDQISALERQIM